MGLKSELMTTADAAALWGITTRRVQILCDNGKVNGAFRMGKTWIIPKGTPKPIDGRTKEAKRQTQEPKYLYHYFERDFGPFKSFAALPIEEARAILIERKKAGKIGNPNIEGFLKKRYDADMRLYNAFVKHGGKPKNVNPIYFFLGEHRQWETAYENPEVIKIPLDEFDSLTVSFTYGDSFAIFNPALFGEEEYWNRVYFADEILEVVGRIGFPPHVEYDFKRGIFPKDKHINDCLLHVEAHVWDDVILGKYRADWMARKEGNTDD